MSFSLFGERTFGFNNPNNSFEKNSVATPFINPNGGYAPQNPPTMPLSPTGYQRGGLFTPPAPSYFPPPNPTHPCNGRGGASCECGGSCRKGEDSLNLKNNFPPTPDPIGPQDLTYENNIIQDILLRSPGSASEMIFKFPEGKGIDKVQSNVESREKMTIAIDSSRYPNIKVDLSATNLGNNIWRFYNGRSSKDVYIDPILPMEILNTISWASYYLATSYVEKIQRKVDERNTPLSIFRPSITPQGFDANGTKCIEHDLFCSDLPIGLKFNNNHTTKTWYVPCVGEIEIDVSDCCRDHDIDLWCAPTQDWASWANVVVIACITNKISFDSQYRYSEANWWCKFKRAILNLFSDIVGVLLSVIAVVWELVGEVVRAALKVVDYVIQGLSIGNLSIPESWYDGLTNAFAFMNPKRVGYDKDNAGINLDSCLCGGSRPTSECGNACRDLCAEFPKYGEPPKCFKCNWRCEYKEDGTPLPRIFDRGTDASLPCCPGTESTAAQECANANIHQNDPCPPLCTHCSWYCDMESTPRQTRLRKPNPKLNCCAQIGGHKCGTGSRIFDPE